MGFEFQEEWKERIDDRLRYRNFSEDVAIIKETSCGENVSLYTVKNKNNVTFQCVPGMSYIGRGRLGFVKGDRSRPVMIGMADFKTREDIRAGITVVTNVSPPGNQISSNVEILIEYGWDIQLFAERGAESDTETKSSYIKVI